MERVVDSSQSARVVQGKWMELELAQRKAILASQVSKWPKATKQEKSEIRVASREMPAWRGSVPHIFFPATVFGIGDDAVRMVRGFQCRHVSR